MNWFAKAAMYLYTFTGTLTSKEWEDTIKRVYKEHEIKLGTKGAMDHVIAMVAYYCMEIGSMYKGTQALGKFRSCYLWPDFRIPDPWWKEQWKKKKQEEEYVLKIREKLVKIPSISPEGIEHHYVARTALNNLKEEINYRHNNELPTKLDNELRVLISIYGGSAINYLYDRGLLKDRTMVPTIVSTYFVEHIIVKEFGEKLITMKSYEMAGK